MDGNAMRIRTCSVLLILILVMGCSTVGDGNRTLVKSCVPDTLAGNAVGNDINNVFPEFTEIGCTEFSVLNLTPDANETVANFQSFLQGRYGVATQSGANEIIELNSVIRRKDTTPSFLYDEEYKAINNAIATVALNEKLTSSKKGELIRGIRARLLNTPRSDSLTTRSYLYEGVDMYNYFPRIEVDFSAKLRSVSELDTFKHLGIVIEIQDKFSNTKFIDYTPKEADVVAFSRGTLKQDNKLTVSPSVEDTVKQAIASSSSTTAPVTSDSETDTTQLTRGLETGFTASESYTNALVDALERRTTGILDDGNVFFASYRSARDKRISGTYTFDLMLEIESKAELFYADNSSEVDANSCDNMILNSGKTLTYVASVPCDDDVLVDIYLVGVARHVYDRGLTGYFAKVPEVENDDVYEHVVVRKIPSVALWSLAGPSWLGLVTNQTNSLVINTLFDEAFYGIYETTQNNAGNTVESFLSMGNGKKFTFTYEGSKTLILKPHSFTREAGSTVNSYEPNNTNINVQHGEVYIEYQIDT
ncbi:MAG: hypothetical protein COB20_02560 [SAR86 cluster bacterium]|uniref:Uncharacterized protein n=1 Tax=SAR86 cluster bacterium TaxID=2030880 RepID=A0A2A4XES3_9GAMM|nr:MAG: hypothetical protein COB20_02560 [SAR86 cluster bacterium]